MKKRKADRQWRMTLVRSKGPRVGTVEAPDAETAIRITIEQFNSDVRGASMLREVSEVASRDRGDHSAEHRIVQLIHSPGGPLRQG
jgi:hypothetical protein